MSAPPTLTFLMSAMLAWVMGIWCNLARYGPNQTAAIMNRESLPQMKDWLVNGHGQPTTTLSTHRAWHALHVAFTGNENGGDPPALWVVGAGKNQSLPIQWNDDAFIHASDTVQQIADYLSRLNVDDVTTNLYAAVRSGVHVYSFEGWEQNNDIVQCGLFQRTFELLQQFYLGAALGNDWVLVSRV
jgi:hypothetical protein